MKNFIKQNWILLLIITLAFVLRFYHLGKESFFWDELDIIWSVKTDQLKIMLKNGFHDLNPPLYSSFLFYYIKYFGINDYALRIPSAIFGSLSVLFIYLIGRDLASKKAGLISAFLLTVSQFNIFYSQAIRSYSLLVFLSLSSTYLCIQYLHNRKKYIYIFYIVLSVLLLYSHSAGFIMLLIQNLYFLLYRNKFKELTRSWIISQVIILLIFALWFNTAVKQIHYFKSESYSYPGNLPFMWNYFKSSFLEYTGSLTMLLFLMVVTIYSLIFNRPNKKIIFFCAGWIFIPVVIMLLMSFFVTYMTCIVRHSIVSSLGIFLLIGYLLAGIKQKYLFYSSIVILVILSFFSLKYYYSNRRFESFREAAEFINQNKEKNSLIVFTKYHGYVAYQTYSKENLNVNANEIWIEDRQLDKVVDISQYKNIWLINSSDSSSFWMPSTQSAEMPDKKLVPNELSDLNLRESLPGIEIYSN